MKNIIFKQIFISFIVVITNVFGQNGNGLNVMPHHIMFGGMYDRAKTIVITNNSTNSITIDSIKYNKSLFDIDYKQEVVYPKTLQSGKKLVFEFILQKYNNIKNPDSLDTLTIFNSSQNRKIDLDIDLKMMSPQMGTSEISGTVYGGENSLAGAAVYFFLNGTYLVDSTVTDSNGNYNALLRFGDYLTAAKAEGYYMEYQNDITDIFNAEFISVRPHSTDTANFFLDEIETTDISFEGDLIDEISAARLSDKIVIVRKGKHNPTKLSIDNLNNIDRNYIAITDQHGHYKIENILIGGSYYIMALPDSFIPGYYNYAMNHQPFWQNADSVATNGMMSGLDIVVHRDSSLGGGKVHGMIQMTNGEEKLVEDALLYAVSKENKLISYSLSSQGGKFKINDLPYGRYKILSQKFGYPDSESDFFDITEKSDSIDNINLNIITSLISHEISITDYKLYQNYPNPFNPSTTIQFEIPTGIEHGLQSVKLNLYDMLGKKIATLIDKQMSSGIYKVTFNSGNRLASGTYIYQLKAGNRLLSKKMILLK